MLIECFEYPLTWQADIIIYQADMDCHQHQRYRSKWFTINTLYQRNLMAVLNLSPIKNCLDSLSASVLVLYRDDVPLPHHHQSVGQLRLLDYK